MASSPRKPFSTPTSSQKSEQSNSPSKHNVHPYAIKTTSTALLTRSNSTGNGLHSQHFYIPTSPNTKHRYSKSDSTNSPGSSTLHGTPRPLPIPPSLESPTKPHYNMNGGYASVDDLRIPMRRTKRADTLPTPPPSSPIKLDDLPSNPKLWTTMQLASYLITALRVRSGENLPVPLAVAKDIATFVKEARLNGRLFLKLTGHDLEKMGINHLWREALLNASRSLRQNVLKGRIWGLDTEDELPTSPYRHIVYNSSSSSIDDISSSVEMAPSRGNAHGRVRGLVATLERNSGSIFDSGSMSWSHGNSESEVDVFGPIVWADDEAAFASGSETSDIEDSQHSNAINSQEPVTPPMDFLRDIPGHIRVASPEQTVQELLESTSLPQDGEAETWEDLDMTETVKRIIPGGEVKSSRRRPLPLSPPDTGVTSNSVNNRSAGADSKPHAKDIFARPLPTPPILDSSSQLQQETSLMDRTTKHKSARTCDQGVQTELEPSTTFCDEAQQTEQVSESEGENLLLSMSLVDVYKTRIAVLERKLEGFVRRDTEQTAIIYRTQAVETDASGADEIINSTESTLVDKTNFKGECLEELSLARRAESSAAEGNNSGADEVIGYKWSTVLQNDDWDLLEGGLSSYVLMVGVGVCAIVLSTILKRLAGRKS